MTNRFSIVFINRERDVMRREAMTRQLAALQLQGERLAAADGYEVPGEFRHLFFSEDGEPKTELSPGEVGCFASHLLVAHRVATEQIAAPTLVLEDDVALIEDLKMLVDETLQNLPPDWDIVRFSGIVKRATKCIKRLRNGRSLVRYSKIPNDAAAYLISKCGAAKLLSFTPSHLPFDVMLGKPWQHDLNIFGIFPTPIIAGHYPSTITAMGRHSDRLPLIKRADLPNITKRTRFNIGRLGLSSWIKLVLINAHNHVLKRIGKSESIRLDGIR